MTAVRFLAELILYVKQRVEGGRGGVISVKTHRICKGNRRCGKRVNRIMTSLAERGLARRHGKVYLIERRTAEAALSALEQWPTPATAATATGTKRTRRRAKRK